MAINNMPLVSVIVTTYNRRDLLTKTIDSILKQTYKNFELIVVDNFSDYDFLSYLRSFNDERIRYFQNANDGIIAVNRNFGIKKAKGDYIAFCDDDDTWYPEKLLVCSHHFNDMDILYHDLRKIGKRKLINRKIFKGRHMNIPVVVDLLIKGNAIYNSSTIVRKSIIDFIDGVNENKDIVGAEDYNTWLKIAEITNRFVYVPKILGEYLYQNNFSQNQKINKVYNYNNASKEFTHYLDRKSIKLYSAWGSYYYGRYLYLEGDYDKAWDYLLNSWRYGQLNVRIRSLYMLVVCLLF
jgi:glycosyltransferase involved in cell wall biosynthesis